MMLKPHSIQLTFFFLELFEQFKRNLANNRKNIMQAKQWSGKDYGLRIILSYILTAVFSSEIACPFWIRIEKYCTCIARQFSGDAQHTEHRTFIRK